MKIVIKGLTKKFGDVVAVNGIDLTAESGKITLLLGPSGCGKTTTLRCIAGLEKPDAGEIYIGREAYTHVENGIFVPPEKRHLGMVFQSYAIWPHMTVFNNVAYGLKVRGVPKSDIKRKVHKALELVGLETIPYRYATQLSGGQQQRVAIARSLVYEPKILLFDEPLSNLDAKLRESTRFQLKELQRKLGITCVYVTHDQAEGMILADKLVLMFDGKIAQIGSPRELYEMPSSRFVAGFIGLTNLVAGKTVNSPSKDGCIKVESGECVIYSSAFEIKMKGEEVLISIRPEKIKIYRGKKGKKNEWRGKVASAVFLGDHMDYRIKVEGIRKEIRVIENVENPFEEGESVYIYANPKDCVAI